LLNLCDVAKLKLTAVTTQHFLWLSCQGVTICNSVITTNKSATKPRTSWTLHPVLQQ
jgi:hypothetical protein